MPPPDLLLDVRHLRVSIPLEEGVVHAVHDAGFSITRGRTLGLVGESGSGKTMTGLALLQLIPPPGRVSGGEILFYPGRHGRDAAPAPPVDIAALRPDSERIRAIRGEEIAMVFQEPMSSLTPVYTIGQQIEEMVRLHREVGSRQARRAAIDMLRRVGLPTPEQRVDAYPHQLSGGMRQRAMIAMALSCGPSLLIADEPTTALDVTVQAQILDLLRELQQELGMAILLVSHDLGVIAEVADEVIVMYAGRIMERGTAEAIFYDPQHPYTQGLLRSAPVMGRGGQKLYSIPGAVPDLRALPRGCAFRPRCAERFAACFEEPELTEVAAGHWVRCWARQERLPREAREAAAVS